ncbi:TPA: tetratricopeptide repeat protein [Providencia stuartii]|nr:tetratricopeptide repeat protein [Providencia stuartii]
MKMDDFIIYSGYTLTVIGALLGVFGLVYGGKKLYVKRNMNRVSKKNIGNVSHNGTGNIFIMQGSDSLGIFSSDSDTEQKKENKGEIKKTSNTNIETAVSDIKDEVNYIKDEIKKAATYSMLGKNENALSNLDSIINKSSLGFNDLLDISQDLKINGLNDVALYFLLYLDSKRLAFTDSNNIDLFNRIGLVYKNKGEYKKAISYYNKSIHLINEKGLIKKKPAVLNNIGGIYANMKKYNLAEEHFNDVLVLIDKLIDKEIDHDIKMSLNITKANALTNKAYNLKNKYIEYKHESDLREALEVIEKAVNISILMSDNESLIRHYGNYANILCESGDYEKQLTYIKKSLRLSRSLNDVFNVICSLNNLGLYFFERNDFESAIGYLTESIKLNDNKYPKYLGLAYAILSLVYKKTHEYDKFNDFYDRAINIFECHELEKEKQHLIKEADEIEKLN